MSNFGKRMVRESKIKEIGQGSDVTGTNDGTNWTSLTIDEDTYGIPQGDVDSDQVIITKRYKDIEKPADYEEVVADFLANVPILATDKFTDRDTFGHPVIDLTVDNFDEKYAIITGWFGIRNTNNNTVQYYCTSTQAIGPSTQDPTYKDFQIERTGSNDFVIKEARCNGTFTLNDGITSVDVYRFTRSDFQNIGIGDAGLTRAEIMLRINNPKVNANLPTTTPSVQGKYVLNCNVDGNSLVDAITWDTPTVPTTFTANEATIYTVNTEGVYFSDGVDNVMNIHSGSNVNIFYAVNNTKPFEISTYAGSWMRFNTDGSVSLTTVDSNTSTAHLYEFKADGIYLDNTKITQ